jgi:hypothetical protein
MRIQINLRISKYRGELLDAVRGTALRQLVRKILRMIIGQLHKIFPFVKRAAFRIRVVFGKYARRLPQDETETTFE